MTTSLDIVQRAYRAWETKDEAALLTLLHENYRAIMPGGFTAEGHDGAKRMLAECPDPNDIKTENEMYIEEGNNVIRIWDAIFKVPVETRLRMAELNVVQDGKIIENEAFFDTGSMPKEMQEEHKKFVDAQKPN